MGVSCRICIQTPPDGVHRAGQRINGILKYVIDKPTEYQSAVLTLMGSSRWTEHSIDRSALSTGMEGLVYVEVSILNVAETYTIPVGAYEFRFEFILPFNIPSSFEDKHSSITYLIMAKFKKPKYFSFSSKFTKQITVYGKVSPTTAAEQLTYGLEKKLFKLFSSIDQMINLKVQIQKSFLRPGENATLHLCVTNDSNTELSHLSIKLCSRTTYTAEYMYFTKKMVVVKTIGGYTCTAPVASFKTETFSCLVRIPPHLYSIQHSKVISKEFYIQVTMHLPFPHRNASSVIPIVIGEGYYEGPPGCGELGDRAEAGVGDLPSHQKVMNDNKTQNETEETSKERQSV